MADLTSDGHEKTEEATEERRLEFQERGDILLSRELTSTIILTGCVLFIGYNFFYIFFSLKIFTQWIYENLNRDLNSFSDVESIFHFIWKNFLKIIIPVCSASFAFSIIGTFIQTRMNFSWKKISFDFSRIDPISGFLRLISFNSLFELLKSLIKIIVISTVAFLVLYSEKSKIVSLLNLNLTSSSIYLFQNLKILSWSIIISMFFISAADYFYNYFVLEKRLKMTKQEVKEDYKKREVDPHVKQKMRKMQKDFISKKTIESTKKATVIITNPTHYAIAIEYKLGMKAPKVLAKGVDYVALKMREIAKENDIPIVENKPLAQSLYKSVKEEQDIPEHFYQALSEIIKFVFKLKGIKITRQKR